MGESDKDKKQGQSPEVTDSDAVELPDQNPKKPEDADNAKELVEAELSLQDSTDHIQWDEAGDDKKADQGAEAEATAENHDDNPQPTAQAPVTPPTAAAAAKPRRSWLGFFNLLLIIAIMVGAYLYWQQELTARQLTNERFAELEQQLSTKLSQVDLSALFEADDNASNQRSELSSRLDELDSGQQALTQASEKLYELYGRDRNDWQLAEVEYLMRIAQHKLILEHDFEGAAMTLRVASEKIAEAADPGLLPVRVKISEEIAELKTRKRVDLVGITLTLTELERQLTRLQPGFAVSLPTENSEAPDTPEKSLLESSPKEVLARLNRFVDSLVRVRYESTAPSATEATAIDVEETLRDWLKLARWAVLDRNENQYVQLMERAEQLFIGFYSQDKDENRDFLLQLTELKELGLTADKPDISGSLFLMRKVLQQRAELEASSGVTE